MRHSASVSWICPKGKQWTLPIDSQYMAINWKHFAALLALCAGNSPVTDEFPAQRPVTRGFDVFFDLRVNKRLSKQSGEAGDLRRHRAHYDVIVMDISAHDINHDDVESALAPEGLIQILMWRHCAVSISINCYYCLVNSAYTFVGSVLFSIYPNIIFVTWFFMLYSLQNIIRRIWPEHIRTKSVEILIYFQNEIRYLQKYL